MLNIDPTEALIATIGIQPIVSKEVERVTLGQLYESQSLGKRIYAEAKSIMRGEESRVPFSAINYKKMLTDLTETHTTAQLESMIAQFPAQLDKIAGNFSVDAKKILAFLNSLLPKQTKETLIGPENIAPPALAVHKFSCIFNVLDNPLRVLAHIAAGSLLKSQAQAVQQMYPSIAAAIGDALREAGTDAKAATKSYNVPPKVAIGWQAWKGVPRLDPMLHAKLQTNFQAAQQQQPKPTQQASGQANSVVAKDALTNTQQALYPEATQKG